MSPPIEEWALAFAITCAVELPLYWALADLRLWEALLLQTATHPALWYLFPYFEPYHSYLFAAESAVITVEALLLWLLWRHVRPPPSKFKDIQTPSRDRGLALAGLVALGVNAVTTCVGLIYHSLDGSF